MTGQQTQIHEFDTADGEEEQQGRAVTKEIPQNTTTLFRWSDDPFVNEAVAEIARRLENAGLAIATPTRVLAAGETATEDVATRIERITTEALSRTHRRSSVAHQINSVLEQMGRGPDDDRWVAPPTEQFPNRDDQDQTVYPDDEVDTATLEEFGIPAEQIEYVDDDVSSLYALSPTFVGNPRGDLFESQVGRFERYLDTYTAALTNEFEGDDVPCMTCGSTAMPTTKGIEGKNLEFNQSFNILATASSVSTPLGMSGRTTAHSGRCAACLVAGFYYTLMQKVVRFKDREQRGGSFAIPVYRIFTPQGDFEQLVGIREDFDEILSNIDAPTEYGSTRQDTLERVRTQSRGLQTLQFYEAILRHVNTVHEGDPYNFSVEHRPTALVSYTSASQKSGRRTRSIGEVEAIDPDRWAYDVIRERAVERYRDGVSTEESYWPFDDLLIWFAELKEIPVSAQDELGYGLLERDLGRLARGLFEVTKVTERHQGENARYVLPLQRAQEYFSFVMQQATTTFDSRIDDEAIESIKRVASSLGGMFYQRDDISVLIGLQNASTANEFLQAFEKASMQAQKKSSTDDETAQYWSGRDDVAQVLQLINDSETFEPAKRMFVIHASLAAQYENAQRASEGDQSE